VLADPTAAAMRATSARARLVSEFALEPWLADYERVYRSILSSPLRVTI
jgi:hypothetical protein